MGGVVLIFMVFQFDDRADQPGSKVSAVFPPGFTGFSSQKPKTVFIV
jgi:hypothetical protein